MLRIHPLAVLVIVFTLLAATPVFADEVELRSGAVFLGRVEKETDTEVVIRTKLGVMTFRRSDVREIRRTGDGAPDGAPAAPETKPFAVSGLTPAVAPVVVGDFMYAVRKDGHVAAWSIIDGKERWSSTAGKGSVTGIAGSPGALYLVTSEGVAARLHGITGDLVWLAKPGGTFAGAPILFRRRVFALQPNVGLVGIESANGSVRGRLDLPVTPDTPLAAAGASMVFGTTDGRLMAVDGTGTELEGVLPTRRPWRGHALAIWNRTIVVAAEEKLLSFDATGRKVTRTVPVPGLAGHPLAADSTRAYVELDGALAALNLVNGRVAWRSRDLPRVIAMAIDGKTIFATTADDSVVAVSRMNGKLLWSLPLGDRSASPPIPVGSGALVLLRNGNARIYVGKAGPAPEPGKEDRPAPVSKTLHSSDGYRVDVPEGWSLSESLTRGAVSLGFRPIAQAPRFALEGVTERDRKLLEVSAYLTVSARPNLGLSSKARAKAWMDELGIIAENSNHRVESLQTRAWSGWTRVSFLEVVDNGMLKGTMDRIALFRRLDDKRDLWLELKVPSRYGTAGVADLEALAGSFRLEKPSGFTPTPDVVVAEAAVAALDQGDAAAFAKHLSDPLKARFAGDVPDSNRRSLRLLTRSSTGRGSRRVVRVRIDTPTETTFTGLTLAREHGRWVVIHPGTLLR